jgi:cell division initiation protein
MTMSPFEVERQEFGRGPWGYRRREVDRFLDEVQGTLVGLWQERANLREENERLNERVARFTALEEQLKNTLLLAQDSAEKACEQARRESELIMREAGQKAREIVHSAHEERQRLEASLRDLTSAEQDSRQRFRALANVVLGHLDESEDAVAESATTLRAVVHNTGEIRMKPGQRPPAKPQVEKTPAKGIATSRFETPEFDPSIRSERPAGGTDKRPEQVKEPVTSGSTK